MFYAASTSIYHPFRMVDRCKPILIHLKRIQPRVSNSVYPFNTDTEEGQDL